MERHRFQMSFFVLYKDVNLFLFFYFYAFYFIDPACSEIEPTRRCYTLDRFCLQGKNNTPGSMDTGYDNIIYIIVLVVLLVGLMIAFGPAIFRFLKKFQRNKSELSNVPSQNHSKQGL